MAVKPGFGRRLFHTVGAIRTGIILLIVVAIVSALGTVILQRPITDPADIQRAYSPSTLHVLDTLGLTNVYHSLWYVLLLAALGISIVFASLDRWPNTWRFFSRPYRRTDSSFRAVLPTQHSIRIANPDAALDATERALKKNGLKSERVVDNDEVSLFAEKSRYAELAVYVVHASLLLIMLGGILDARWGYNGYVSLVPGQPAITSVQLRDNTMRKLPFALRCDGAGQENYTGQFAMVPKRWWSNLTVLVNGEEAKHKVISVNDPLVFHGVRFYQSGFGVSSELKSALIRLTNPVAPGMPNQPQALTMGGTSTLADGTIVKLLRFIPDAYSMDGTVYQRSKDLGDAAAEVEIAKGGNTRRAWLIRTDSMPQQVLLAGPYDGNGAPIPDSSQMLAKLDLLPFTGLQVSHEPGQWAVWSGCLMMGVGLLMAFWVLHQRYWAIVTTNKAGQLVLWIGGAANKNKEGFAVRFGELAQDIEKEIDAVDTADAELCLSTART
jgi:cytochrome c biogenesis protein